MGRQERERPGERRLANPGADLPGSPGSSSLGGRPKKFSKFFIAKFPAGIHSSKNSGTFAKIPLADAGEKITINPIVKNKFISAAKAAGLSFALIAAVATVHASTPIDQITGQTFGPNAEASQHFGSPNSAFDIAQIDNFSIGASNVNLNSVDAVFLGFAGFTSYNNVTAWDIEVYSSVGAAASNLNGDVIHLVLAAGNPNISITTGYVGADPLSALVSFDLNSSGLSLNANTGYFLTVIPELNFAAGGGQLGIFDSSGGTPGGANSFQANPAGGFGFPGNIQQNTVNAALRLTATAVPEPSTTFTMIFGVALLSGILFVRRRSALKA